MCTRPCSLHKPACRYDEHTHMPVRELHACLVGESAAWSPHRHTPTHLLYHLHTPVSPYCSPHIHFTCIHVTCTHTTYVRYTPPMHMSSTLPVYTLSSRRLPITCVHLFCMSVCVASVPVLLSLTDSVGGPGLLLWGLWQWG